MKIKSYFLLSIFLSIATISNAQIKLHQSGGISIGSTNDPLNIIKLDKPTTFAQSATFANSATFNGISTFTQPTTLNSSATFNSTAEFNGSISFDGQVTFNDGTNIFEKYNAGGGIKVLGSAGTLSMYGDQSFYRINTSLSTITFEDPVQFNSGLSVSIGGGSEFYSTTTFRGNVNFGTYNQINNTIFYGSTIFESAISSASFTCNQNAVFNQNVLVAGAFTNYSDKHLKKDIKDISAGSLEKILKIKGVTYLFETDPSDQTPRSGFIAQDLQKVFPDLVVEEEKGLAIKSLELIPYLVEAIKEQQKEIESLKQAIGDLPSEKSAQTTTNSTNDDFISNSELFQNTPNPFHEETTIKYSLADDTRSATLMVCDMSGRLVKNYELNPDGNNQVVITGGELDPGQYIYTLVADGKLIGTKQMVLTN